MGGTGQSAVKLTIVGAIALPMLIIAALALVISVNCRYRRKGCTSAVNTPNAASTQANASLYDVSSLQDDTHQAVPSSNSNATTLSGET